MDPAFLERAALHYLHRYASSGANLRRVLMRKIERSVAAHGTDREQAAAWLDALIARLAGNGLLNDGAYAEGRAATLFRQGRPRQAIGRALAVKGVSAEVVETALAGIGRQHADPDLAAAVGFARRRRLGPWRAEAERASARDQDFAIMGRRGFDYHTARRVILAEDAASLELEAAMDPERDG